MKKHRCRKISSFLQLLEPRTLLSYSVSPNSAVLMNTSIGEIAIQLYSDMPITTANFLSYVNAGAYNNTIFHRTTFNGDSNQDTFGIVQGGGFTNNDGTLNPVATNAPITDEATDAHPNSVGTIGMARTSSPDSATTQFFFNTTDNSSIFDPDESQGNAGYAVFGNVLRGFGIVETIDNMNTSNSATTSDGETLNPPETSSGSFVTVYSATEADTLTVTTGPNDASGAKTVTFKDPTTKSNVTVNLASADATLTFTGTDLQATPKGSNITVTGNNLQLQAINSTDATAKSSLSISGKSSDVGEIDITGSLNSISASGITLSGDINLTGGVSSIKLAGTTASGFISIDTDSVSGAATTISIPNLADISIQSNSPISKLTAKNYKVTDGTNRGIEASSIASASVPGVFQGTLISPGNITTIKAGALNGADIQAAAIGTVSLQSLTNGYIYSTGAYAAKTLAIGQVTIKGALSSGEIAAVGNIGSITAGSINDALITAGIDGTFQTTPADSFSDALAANATLQSVTLKSKGTTPNFSSSQINAYNIGSLSLGRVATTNSSSLSIVGIQAHTIGSLVAETDKSQSLDLTNITTQSQADSATSTDDLGVFTIDMI